MFEICRDECDRNEQCQGFVYDEQFDLCFFKQCSCRKDQTICRPERHETYLRKKTRNFFLFVSNLTFLLFFSQSAECPGLDYFNDNGLRRCFFSIYNYNVSSSNVYNWETSRRLCQNFFNTASDLASFENNDVWAAVARNLGKKNNSFLPIYDFSNNSKPT